MSIEINAHRWRFLRRENAAAYIKAYEKIRKEGWKTLVPTTTGRQLATARAILDRMKKGQKGVLLADDVGLGKTTIAVLCALVFAGSGKRVRILAPNEMMARRWRQELEVHVGAVARVAKRLDLDQALRRIRNRSKVKRLYGGTIEVSTHQKAGQRRTGSPRAASLACDLLIIDEAHRARAEHSTLAKQVRSHDKAIGRVIVLTATPFSIDPNDLARLLERIGGKAAKKPMRTYARLLDDLWRGRSSGTPEDLARQLVRAATAAVEAMKPFVIRHGIRDLPRAEQRQFGQFGEVDRKTAADASEVPEEVLEAMLRTDRALALGQRCNAWSTRRRNDPRYHVAVRKLDADLRNLLEKTKGRTDGDAEALGRHGRRARKLLRDNGRHPKIADTVKSTRARVDEGEKVLIFCDHHLPAAELTAALAEELRWRRGAEHSPGRETWRSAWDSIFSGIRSEVECADGRTRARARLGHYLAWLMSDGVRLQIETWIGAKLRSTLSNRQLKRLLETTRARGHPSCDSVAKHATQLYKQLVDPESRSTSAVLLGDDATLLPGTTMARVAAVCEPEPSMLRKHRGVFYPQQPDATLAVFNSPFGPDVLVTTDRLSEGVDLHRFCRHLIHHELDPSPVRTVQRNGRLRRVDNWSARTKQPIMILYPALRGTRDERLVEIMRNRLLQFDLLLGGVRVDVDPDDTQADPATAAKVLALAGRSLRRIRLGLPSSTRR